jgi:polyisoprenoid-binding protein YceI
MAKLKVPQRNLVTLGCALLAFSLASTAVAQEGVLELDPAQTQVNFTLGDVLHTVHGTFKLKRGTVKFDPATGHAGGLVVVDATSGDSGSHARDHKMHKDILESAQYPEITFTPQQVQGQIPPQGDFKVQVLGTFTLHGASHPLALVIQAHLAGQHLTADTQFTIPYESWGLKNPSTLFLRVSDTVDISIHTAGEIKLASTH